MIAQWHIVYLLAALSVVVLVSVNFAFRSLSATLLLLYLFDCSSPSFCYIMHSSFSMYAVQKVAILYSHSPIIYDPKHLRKQIRLLWSTTHKTISRRVSGGSLVIILIHLFHVLWLYTSKYHPLSLTVLSWKKITQ